MLYFCLVYFTQKYLHIVLIACIYVFGWISSTQLQMYECAILSLEEMPDFKRRILPREIHGNTVWEGNIHSWWIHQKCCENRVITDIFWEINNKIAERQIQFSYNTAAEKGVPSAFLEPDKYSQVSLAVKSALKRKLSTTVQPHDKVPKWVNQCLTCLPQEDPVGVSEIWCVLMALLLLNMVK